MVADLFSSSPTGEKPRSMIESQNDIEHEETQDERPLYTEEEERAVVKKIDMVIMPLMCFTYFVQYLDKQCFGYAAVFGLITDLKLSQSEYSWCSSIFFLGQLVSEYPFIYLMSRLHLTKLVGVTILIWGLICMSMAAPKDFAGFAAVRFLLGFSEGCVSPAFVTLCSIWYKKSEQPFRIAAWISMNGCAYAIGALLMYGIGKNEHLSLAPWRVLFLLIGGMTLVLGVLFYIIMPSSPDKAWFMTPREREVLKLRLLSMRDGGDKTNFSLSQLKEALTDIKSYFAFFFGVFITMQTPVATFASLVISDIGYNKFQTMLFTAPVGALQASFVWLGAIGVWLIPRKTCLVVIIMAVPPLVGCVLLLELPTPSAGWGIIVSAWIASCIAQCLVIVLSLLASNVKGNTKRAVVNAMLFMGYCAGAFASPQLWTEKPRYFKGITTAITSWCCLIALSAVYWVVCHRDNKAREARENQDGTLQIYHSGEDITDKQDKAFRYRV